MSTQSMLDVIKEQLDRMEKLQKEDHATLLEIHDAVTVDPAVTLDVTAGPPEEQP
jgi:hypothetical protein